MKQEKITTGKGEFLVIDLPSYEEIEKELQIFGHDQGLTNDDLNNYFKHILPDFNKCYELSKITEEEASEVVSSLVADEQGNKSYVYTLHSLLKSKGIHLYENPYKYTKTEAEEIADKLARCRFITKEETKAYIEESKTFYNPHIIRV